MRQRHQISETSLEPAMQYTNILHGRTQLRLSWWFLCCFEDALWVAGVLVSMIASQHDGVLFVVWFPGNATLAQNPSVRLAFPRSCSLFQLRRPSQTGVIIRQVSSDTRQHALTVARQSGILFPALSSVGDGDVLTLVAAGQKKKALTTARKTWMTSQLPIATVLFIIEKLNDTDNLNIIQMLFWKQQMNPQLTRLIKTSVLSGK